MLTKIHCIFSTHPFRTAGTSSKPVLILGNNRTDLLHHTFDIQKPISGGSSHYFTIDVRGQGLNTYFQFMRLGIRGDDMWVPESVFVFGEQDESESLRFQPLAIQFYDKELLSTDEYEGRISIPLKRASLGSYYTQLSRVMVMIRNNGQRHAGTKSPVLLTIEGKKEELLRLEIPEGKLATDDAVYFTGVWFRNIDSSNEIRSIRLHIGGDDQWTPGSVYVFGIDREPDEYEQVVPLVYIQDWAETGLGSLSEDAKEGKDSVTLYQAFL